MNINDKPWFLLNPDDIDSQWWRHNKIIDIYKATTQKTIQDSLAHIIIQDGNMGGHFWHFSTWYIDDPNRYANIIYTNRWPFNKQLLEMNNNEIVYLNDFPDVKFIVYRCKFGLPEQNKYCKILERIHLQLN